jgi:hypothetical protein
MAASPSPAAFAGYYPRRVDQRLQCDVCKAAKTTVKCAKYGGCVCNPGTGFVCSSGWLSNFEKHYSTFSRVWHGEASSAPAASAEFATSEVRELLSEQKGQEAHDCGSRCECH